MGPERATNTSCSTHSQKQNKKSRRKKEEEEETEKMRRQFKLLKQPIGMRQKKSYQISFTFTLHIEFGCLVFVCFYRVGVICSTRMRWPTTMMTDHNKHILRQMCRLYCDFYYIFITLSLSLECVEVLATRCWLHIQSDFGFGCSANHRCRLDEAHEFSLLNQRSRIP